MKERRWPLHSPVLAVLKRDPVDVRHYAILRNLVTSQRRALQTFSASRFSRAFRGFWPRRPGPLTLEIMVSKDQCHLENPGPSLLCSLSGRRKVSVRGSVKFLLSPPHLSENKVLSIRSRRPSADASRTRHGGGPGVTAFENLEKKSPAKK